MHKKIVDRILESAEKGRNPGKKVFFSDPRYEAVDFSKEHFRQIKSISETTAGAKSGIKPAGSGRKIVFVDGGNSEVIGAPDFSLQLIRIYYSIWQNSRRIKSHRDEFFILINTAPVKDKGHEKIKYYAEMFKKDFTTKGIIEDELKGQLQENIMPEGNDLIYDSMDGTITDGINRARPSKIAEIARRFTEIKACIFALNELKEGDFIIMDGTLQSSVTNESKQLNRLYELALAKGVIIAALSKTNTLLTDTGNSAAFAIKSIAPSAKSRWFYNPVAKIVHPDHKAEIFFVKLHSDAKNIFRLEIQKDAFVKNPKSAEELIGLLAEISKDPVFLGYPYGLIEADKFARISNNEMKSIRIQFMAKAGKKWEELASKNSDVSAHDILDNIG